MNHKSHVYLYQVTPALLKRVKSGLKMNALNAERLIIELK